MILWGFFSLEKISFFKHKTWLGYDKIILSLVTAHASIFNTLRQDVFWLNRLVKLVQYNSQSFASKHF